jgi:hypothetical protein
MTELYPSDKQVDTLAYPVRGADCMLVTPDGAGRAWLRKVGSELAATPRGTNGPLCWLLDHPADCERCHHSGYHDQCWRYYRQRMCAVRS